MKTCLDCKISKPLEEFYESPKGALGRQAACKPCHKIRSNAWRKDHPGRAAAIRKRCDSKHAVKRSQGKQQWRLKKLYQLTETDYQKALDSQGGVCDICKRVPSGQFRLFVDHCHESGKLRGLLCSRCNSALGQLKDSIKNLLSAVEYLKKYECTR